MIEKVHNGNRPMLLLSASTSFLLYHSCSCCVIQCIVWTFLWTNLKKRTLRKIVFRMDLSGMGLDRFIFPRSSNKFGQTFSNAWF